MTTTHTEPAAPAEAPAATLDPRFGPRLAPHYCLTTRRGIGPLTRMHTFDELDVARIALNWIVRGLSLAETVHVHELRDIPGGREAAYDVAGAPEHLRVSACRCRAGLLALGYTAEEVAAVPA